MNTVETIETWHPRAVPLHFYSTYIRKGDRREIERPLCLNGNAHEQHNTTKNRRIVTCPNCLEALRIADMGLTLEVAVSTMIAIRIEKDEAEWINKKEAK